MEKVILWIVFVERPFLGLISMTPNLFLGCINCNFSPIPVARAGLLNKQYVTSAPNKRAMSSF